MKGGLFSLSLKKVMATERLELSEKESRKDGRLRVMRKKNENQPGNLPSGRLTQFFLKKTNLLKMQRHYSEKFIKFAVPKIHKKIQIGPLVPIKYNFMHASIFLKPELFMKVKRAPLTE